MKLIEKLPHSATIIVLVYLVALMTAAGLANWLLERPTATVMRWFIRYCSSAINDVRVHLAQT
jgi:hypothetical protein